MTATKKTQKTPAKKTEKPDRSMAQIPPGERRAKLVAYLKKAGAVSSKKAVSIGDLAEALKSTKFDVYGCVSGTSGKAGSNPSCLLAHGLVKVARVEGVQGISVYLTPKGKEADYSVPPFVRAASAASKE